MNQLYHKWSFIISGDFLWMAIFGNCWNTFGFNRDWLIEVLHLDALLPYSWQLWDLPLV